MRVTRSVVEAVANLASELTGDEFGLAPSANAGDDMCYIDKRQRVSWRGPNAARQAIAYYLGVAESANADQGRDLGALWERLPLAREATAEVRRDQSRWLDQGHGDFNEWLARRRRAVEIAPKPGHLAHVYSRLTDDGATFVKRVDYDSALYDTSKRHWEVAEGVMTGDLADQPPGQYRVEVRTFQGRTFFTLDRELPPPEAWASLPTWATDDTPSRGFARNVLEWYPGTTLKVVGEHIRDFAAHYRGEIGTTELAERTGYTLPPGTPRPHHPNAEHVAE